MKGRLSFVFMGIGFLGSALIVSEGWAGILRMSPTDYMNRSSSSGSSSSLKCVTGETPRSPYCCIYKGDPVPKGKTYSHTVPGDQGTLLLCRKH